MIPAPRHAVRTGIASHWWQPMPRLLRAAWFGLFAWGGVTASGAVAAQGGTTDTQQALAVGSSGHATGAHDGFSEGRPGGALPRGWRHVPLNQRKRPTAWALQSDGAGVVLSAHANASASLVIRVKTIDLDATPVVAWRWKIDAHPKDADNSRAAKEDSVARLVFAFDGKKASLPLADRLVMQVAKSMSGHDMPYATLMYVVSGVAPVGAVVPNPHTRRVQMVVASTASQALNSWVSMERNVREDFLSAFGEEPGRLIAYGVMSDTDNTGAQAHAWFGDIGFLPASGLAALRGHP